jgi:hypothetical protein
VNDKLAEALAKFTVQKGKNMTLLILCGFILALVHKESTGSIFGALCLAVGAPAVAEKWPASGSAQ